VGTAPQLEPRHAAEYEQRLTDCTGSSMHQYALCSLYLRSAVQELVRSHPAQDQRGGLCRIDARRHRCQVARLERAIGSIRSEHRHVGHTVAKLKSAHAVAELIDFPNHIVAHYKRWTAGRRLRVEMASDQRVGVFKTRGDHPDPHLARTSRR
jgi:hypothetical protein